MGGRGYFFKINSIHSEKLNYNFCFSRGNNLKAFAVCFNAFHQLVVGYEKVENKNMSNELIIDKFPAKGTKKIIIKLMHVYFQV